MKVLFFLVMAIILIAADKKEDISVFYKLDLNNKIGVKEVKQFDSTSVFIKEGMIDYEKLLIPVLKELRKKSKKLYILEHPEMFR